MLNHHPSLDVSTDHHDVHHFLINRQQTHTLLSMDHAKNPLPRFDDCRDRLIIQSELDHSHFLATPNLIQHAEFISGSQNAQQLVNRTPDDNNDAPTEFIMTGIFQISADNFFLTSDGRFKPGSGLKFEDTKPSCRLIMPNAPGWRITATESETIFNNVKALEKINISATSNLKSVVDNHPLSIKLSHLLFKKSSANETQPPIAQTWSIANWPVSDRCVEDLCHLQQNNYEVNPIPCYDKHGDPIPPSEYQHQLQGAIVYAYFTLIRKGFGSGSGRRHFSTALLREIQVIQDPTVVQSPLSKRKIKPINTESERPHKKRHLDNRTQSPTPSTSQHQL